MLLFTHCYQSMHLLLLKVLVLLFLTEDQLFGVPLTIMLQNDQKRNPRASIPILFKEVSTIFHYYDYFYMYSTCIIRTVQ